MDSFQKTAIAAFGLIVLGLSSWVLVTVHNDSASIERHTAALESVTQTLTEIKGDIRELRSDLKHPNK